MGLDLHEILNDWDCPDNEVAARLIAGRDSTPFVQLRIEMGVLQMSLEGRPDGTRYRGMTNALEYILHERRARQKPVDADAWDELEREFNQYNYRRVAMSRLIDQAAGQPDPVIVRPHLVLALADVDVCQRILDLLELNRGDERERARHRPTLAFNKARLAAQLRVVDRQFDEAVEEIARGRVELDALLTEIGLELEDRAQDPGLAYLCELEQQIRNEYGIPQTLRERLADAVEREDFETAAALRDELRRRTAGKTARLPAPRHDA